MIKLLFLALLALHLNASADDLKTESVDEPTTVTYPIKAGVAFQYYRYVEPGLISHTGFFIGAWLNFDYHLLFYKGTAQAEILSGQLNYDGAICDISTTPSKCQNYKAKTNDVIFKIAHRFAFQVTDHLEIFAGLGYRYLYDKGEGPGFYIRTGQYLYLPLGFTVTHELPSERGSLSLDVEYAPLLAGEIESQLSNVNRAYSDVKHKQNKGNVIKLSLGFAPPKRPDDLRPWFYAAYFEKWSIPKSDEAELLINGGHSGNYFHEPENFSESVGIKVGFGY